MVVVVMMRLMLVIKICNVSKWIAMLLLWVLLVILLLMLMLMLLVAG